MFERATKIKLRFETNKGKLSVEDLWDLPFTGACSLNSLAIELHGKLKSETLNFVETKSPTTSLDELRFELVKSVITSRQAVIAAQEKKGEVQARNRKILDIIETKEDEALSNKTVGQLKKLLA